VPLTELAVILRRFDKPVRYPGIAGRKRDLGKELIGETGVVPADASIRDMANVNEV
jgi:hypothetical protein